MFNYNITYMKFWRANNMKNEGDLQHLLQKGNRLIMATHVRKVIGAIVLGLILFGSSSCEDWLVVEPDGETLLEDFWKKESQANSALAGCYQGFTSAGTLEKMLLWGEIRGDNWDINLNTYYVDMHKLYYNNITSTNSFINWADFYAIINDCNTFLHFAPNVVDADDNFTKEELGQMNAEAKTLRALAYFYLVRTFGEVPLTLEPYIDDSQDFSIPKSSENVILDTLILDLLNAEKFARDFYETPEETKGRVTKNTVRALLADMYLWKEDYQKCIQMCNSIIYDGSLELELEAGDDFISNVFYNGNSTESIFELQYDNENRNNQIRTFYLDGIGNNDSYGMFVLNPNLIPSNKLYSPFNKKIGGTTESSEDYDIRWKEFVDTRDGKTSGTYRIFKYIGVDRSDLTDGGSSYMYRNDNAITANFIIYRLSDILLMKAEALIELKDDISNAEAMIEINKTYMRSNPEIQNDSLLLDNYSSYSELQKLILRERQRELMFEGKRWFDLVRYARRTKDASSVTTYTTSKPTAGSGDGQSNKFTSLYSLYLPISKNEVEKNDSLIQNPYYENLVEE